MDKQKVEWIIKNLEVFVSMLKDELLTSDTTKIESDAFESVHPIQIDDDVEYYEED